LKAALAITLERLKFIKKMIQTGTVASIRLRAFQFGAIELIFLLFFELKA
jgi:hypothetical protein